MTTHAVYVGSKLSTSNPSLYATGSKTSRTGGVDSRIRAHDGRTDSRKQAADQRSRPYLTATPHSSSRKHAPQPPPTPKEEDLESVLDTTEIGLPYDETGKRCYAKACKKLQVVPSSYVLTKLTNSKQIDCKHYGLGPQGTVALSIALVVNTRVTSVNLQGNDIGQKGISYVQKMVSENHNISELNISDNKLGSFGANAISRMLVDNRSLTKIEMAGNGFTDADAVLLAKPIQEHPELEHVDLSHNMFGDLSARLFEDMISENSSIATLDMSWNLFRIKGATSIAKGLKENTFMKTFNFSWNGFGDDGATEFAKALKVNNVLTTLDLTSCRVCHDGFMKIIMALGLNESLVHLKVGKNNIPEEFAEAALSLLKSYPALKLETLDMTDCTFSPKFEEHIQNVNELHRNMKVLYGYNNTYGKNQGDFLGDILKEGLECLRDFCRETNVSLVELFERFDADNSMSVSLQEFQEGLKEAGVPLSLYKIEMFAQALDKDGDGEVDYSEMVLQLKAVE